MAQYPANIDLSSLDGTNGFKISGVATSDGTGYSAAPAGDINGDGFADFIIGADGVRTQGFVSGAAYVVFGGASGFGANFELSSLDGTNGFTIQGDGPGSCGRTVASAGDVNGDGIPDLIIGNVNASPHGVQSGASYVVFGSASGFGASFDVSSLDGTNGFKISGEAEGDWSSFSVASAGDLNGDGFGDVAIGAPHPGGPGASYVVFGKASGFAANIDLSSLDGSNGFKISGDGSFDRNGNSVASAGDVNGDGFDDLLVGTPESGQNGPLSGASYVIFGKASGFGANIDLSSLDGTNGFAIKGLASNDTCGGAVASAGDVNGDGIADLIISAPWAQPNGFHSGACYVVFGKTSGFGASFDLSSLDGTNGFKISGAAAGDWIGHKLGPAGDFNGDGFGDLIITAFGDDTHGPYTGACYVVFGKASGFGANIELSSLDGTNGFKLSGVAAGDYSGDPAVSAGDVNGDGLDDVMVSASQADPHGANSGASYVIFGQLPDTAVNRTGTVASQGLAGGNFNDTLSGLGGDDRLFGNGGDDVLKGGTGDDTLNGGAGTTR